MRLGLLAFGSLILLAACASNEYSSVPEPTGEWAEVNPPGFQPLPPATPLRPAVQRVRAYGHTPAPLRTAQTTQSTVVPTAAPAVTPEAHP